jgi:branched-chain amino acid transport system substrate-binding protein
MQRKKIFVLLASTTLIAIFLSMTLLTGCSSSPTASTPPPGTTTPVTSPTSSTSVTTTTAPTSTSPTAQAEVLKIGVLVSLSGFFSGFDSPQVDECQIVADIWNEKGGIDIGGKKYTIQISAEDGKSSLDGYTAAANKLIYDQGIKFIAGPMGYFGSAISSISTPNKVIVSMGYNTLDPAQLSQDTPYNFLGNSATAEAGIAGATYMHELYPEVKNVVFVCPDDGSIPAVQPVAQKALAGVGVNLLGDTIGYNNETVDFSPIVAKIMQRNPDAVYMINGLAQHEGNILRGLREAGWKKPFCDSGAIPAADVLSVAGADASTNYFCSSVDFNEPSNPPAMQEITKRMAAKFGVERVNSMHLLTATAMWSLLYAIQNAKSLETAAVRDAWEKLDSIPGTPFGDGRMGGTQTYGIRHAVATAVPYSRLIDGQVVFGKWVTGIVTP